MDEAEWRKSKCLAEMCRYLEDNAFTRAQALKGLFGSPAPRLSKRKWQLFLCGFCRRFWPLMDEWQRSAVEVAERSADSRSASWELAAARATVEESLKPARARAANEAAERNRWGIGFYYTFNPERAALDAADWHLDSPPGPDGTIPLREPFRRRASWGILLALGDALGARGSLGVARVYGRQAWPCDVLRDIFGNPFRAPAVVSVRWSWAQDVVRDMARVVYEEQLWKDLPILADAIEEAGCTDPELLGHLRGPGPHVRGCWAVDLILSKDR
jgi:hypothetical protein